MVSVRACEPADLDTFQALGSEVHVDRCRERFARDASYRTAAFTYVDAPVPNAGVWLRTELT
jgi:hypothetical protein